MGLLISVPDAAYSNYLRVIPKMKFNFMAKIMLDAISGLSAVVGRTTTGTYIDADGIIKTAAVGAPRYDYNPTTLALRGLLAEGAETNLFTYSENMTSWMNGGGLLSNVSWSAASRTAPDGAMTMTKLVEAVTTSLHYVQGANWNIDASSFVTLACFVAAAERSIVRIGLTTKTAALANVNAYEVEFNATTGVATVISGTGTFEAEYYAASGCWRVFLTVATGATETLMRPSFALCKSAGVNSYLGVSGSGIYLWGMQYATKPSIGSYIPTAGASVMRAAEDVYFGGTGFSAAFNPVQGALYVKATARDRDAAVLLTGDTGQTAAALTTTDVSGNIMLIGRDSTSPNINRPKAYSDDAVPGGGGTVTDIAHTWRGNSLKGVLAYQVNNFALSIGGDFPIAMSAQPVGVPTRLQIGSSRVNKEYWEGWVEEVSLFGLRINDALLPEITK